MISIDVLEYVIIQFISYNDIIQIVYNKKWNYNNVKFDKWFLDIIYTYLYKLKKSINKNHISRKLINYIKKDININEFNLIYVIKKRCKIDLYRRKKYIRHIYVDDKKKYNNIKFTGSDCNIIHTIIGLKYKYDCIYYIYDLIHRYDYRPSFKYVAKSFAWFATYHNNILANIIGKYEIPKKKDNNKYIYRKILETKSIHEFFQHKNTKSSYTYK